MYRGYWNFVHRYVLNILLLSAFLSTENVLNTAYITKCRIAHLMQKRAQALRKQVNLNFLHIRLSVKFMMYYFERKRNENTYRETIKMSAKLQEVIRPHLKLLWGCHLQTDAAYFVIIRKLLILFLTCLWYLHVEM